MLARLFVDAVNKLYTSRVGDDTKTGAITVVQSTSSELRLNPHLHVVFLDGAYRARADEVVWRELPRLTTEDIASVLETTLRRIQRHLRRHGVLPGNDALVDADQDDGADQEANLAVSAVSGRTPPAGPSWQRGLPQLVGKPLSRTTSTCAHRWTAFRVVGPCGPATGPIPCSLNAATRADAEDTQGR